nr:GNAT family N-acetyltransferase [Maliibacterium massiliense]
MQITYTSRISVADYNALRKVVGWSAVEPEMAQQGLQNAYYFVCAMEGSRAVGMLRVIGDGGYSAFIDDVAVHPDYQGRGIGKTMLGMALAHLRGTLKPGQSLMVSLLAATGKESFYERFGFARRPNDAHGAGMTQWFRPEGSAD